MTADKKEYRLLLDIKAQTSKSNKKNKKENYFRLEQTREEKRFNDAVRREEKLD